MRIVIRPTADGDREIDITERLVAAIAEELWRHLGGNSQLNWLEAERHLARLTGNSHAAEGVVETSVAHSGLNCAIEAPHSAGGRRPTGVRRRPLRRLGATRGTCAERRGSRPVADTA